jgi:hypothetical protein
MDYRGIIPRAVVKIGRRIELAIYNHARLPELYNGKAGYSIEQHTISWKVDTWTEAEPLIRRLVSQSWASALLNIPTEAPLDIPADVKAYLEIH